MGTLLLFLCLAFGIVFLRWTLVRYFSTNPDVVSVAVGLCLILAPFIVVDSLQTVIEGVLRGLGLQKKAFIAKISSMLGVRLFGAALLAFPLGLGINGIWFASTTGMA